MSRCEIDPPGQNSIRMFRLVSVMSIAMYETARKRKSAATPPRARQLVTVLARIRTDVRVPKLLQEKNFLLNCLQLRIER